MHLTLSLLTYDQYTILMTSGTCSLLSLRKTAILYNDLNVFIDHPTLAISLLVIA